MNMNRDEYSKQPGNRSTYEYKYVHRLLNEWKQQNEITALCVVHHRDDNDEVRAYNEAHYELWGFNEDGTFEYGKYVLFMTRSEHRSHHNLGKQNPSCTHPFSEERRKRISQRMSGEGNPMYGKPRSEYVKQRCREAHLGTTLTTECKKKIALNNKTKYIKLLFDVYKQNGGRMKWQAFEHALKAGEITFELQPISVFINKELTNDHN